MTSDQMLGAVNAAEITPIELTTLLRQGAASLSLTKLKAELEQLEKDRVTVVTQIEEAKQAKQAEITAAINAQAAALGVGS